MRFMWLKTKNEELTADRPTVPPVASFKQQRLLHGSPLRAPCWVMVILMTSAGCSSASAGIIFHPRIFASHHSDWVSTGILAASQVQTRASTAPTGLSHHFQGNYSSSWLRTTPGSLLFFRISSYHLSSYYFAHRDFSYYPLASVYFISRHVLSQWMHPHFNYIAWLILI